MIHIMTSRRIGKNHAADIYRSNNLFLSYVTYFLN